MTDPGQHARPRRGRPGHDQETVLQGAVDLFIRQGYDATSMGDLARELGLTKSAIYHHVPGKEHLLALALDEALDALSDRVEQAGTAPGTAVDRLRDAVRGSVEVLVAHRSAVTLLLRVHGNSEVERDALRRRREVDAVVAGMVADAVAEGSLRSDLPPDLASRLVFGTVNSLVEWVQPEGRYRSEEIADAVVALAFEGLAVRPDGPPGQAS
jgi:AcrR family transcriptional regulator